jgi:hypothetical protein
MSIFDIPILGIIPTFSSHFSCLRLFIPVELKDKAAFARFLRMPLFSSGVGDEEAEAEDYQGREGARGMGGVGVYGAGGGTGICGEQAVGRLQELRFCGGAAGTLCECSGQVHGVPDRRGGRMLH